MGKTSDFGGLGVHELIDAHHYLVAPFDAARELVGRRLDLVLEVVGFDGRHRAAPFVDGLDVLARPKFHLVG